MRILLASPFYSQHWDAGHFWARALSRLGHELVLWDYRIDRDPPNVECDFALVLKGSVNAFQQARRLAPVRVCYWPDALGREPVTEQFMFSTCDRVYTMVRPTPEGMTWLPGAYDERIHRPSTLAFQRSSIFCGTYTARKQRFLDVIQPADLFGNDWPDPIVRRPRYLHEYVEMLSRSQVAVNIHRADGIGLTRRFFEFMACTFTISDRIPGVEEILGKELADLVSFTTPEEGRDKLAHFLKHPALCRELHEQETAKIRGYTYIDLARILTALPT